MSDLLPLREVIERHGLSARKAFGQNFLLDTQLLDRIAALPGNLDNEYVYEVGPGPGGLTRALLERGAHVTAVERDPRCISALDEVVNAYPEKLAVIEDDALEVDEPDIVPRGAHVVSNLPYNVGSALLVRWLTEEPWPPWWASLTLMFQREVAERIVARPGDGAYGRLSVLCQWRSTAEIAMKIHRSAFVPPPKVMSAVVHIVPDAARTDVDGRILENLTRAAFGQRRKMLRQSLKSVVGARDALTELGIDETLRAENLSVGEYVALAGKLSAIGE